MAEKKEQAIEDAIQASPAVDKGAPEQDAVESVAAESDSAVAAEAAPKEASTQKADKKADKKEEGSTDSGSEGGDSGAAGAKPAKKTLSKNKRKFVIEGIAYVNASFNNTIVSIANLRGDVLSWSSAGACGFKGSKKGTPYAGQLAAAAAAKVVTDPKTGCGMERVKVYVNGFGASRDSVIRTLAASFKITALVDKTSVPFNGCRNSKERRA